MASEGNSDGFIHHICDFLAESQKAHRAITATTAATAAAEFANPILSGNTKLLSKSLSSFHYFPTMAVHVVVIYRNN